jgi:hypothetical protein
MNGKPGKRFRLMAAAMLKAGLVDTLKGSYYANINPVIDTFDVPSAQRNDYPEYYGVNICVCSYK